MYLRFTAQETRVNFALTYNFFMNGVAVRFTACNKKRKFNSNKKKKNESSFGIQQTERIRESFHRQKSIALSVVKKANSIHS